MGFVCLKNLFSTVGVPLILYAHSFTLKAAQQPPTNPYFTLQEPKQSIVKEHGRIPQNVVPKNLCFFQRINPHYGLLVAQKKLN